MPNYRTYNYQATTLTTKQKFLYGKFEIKFKIQKRNGFWPSFWLWSVNGGRYEEIDIFEFRSDKIKKFHYGISQDVNGSGQPTAALPNEPTNHSTNRWIKKIPTNNGLKKFKYNEWNIVTVYWEPTFIIWFVNGFLAKVIDLQNDVCSNQKDPVANGRVLYPYDLPKNLVVNNYTHSGPNGKFYNLLTDSHPKKSDLVPHEFDIDYIRVWQRLDCNNDINVTSCDNTLTSMNMGRNITLQSAPCGWTAQCTQLGLNVNMKPKFEYFATEAIHLGSGFNSSIQQQGGQIFLHSSLSCPPYTALRTNGQCNLDSVYYTDQLGGMPFSEKKSGKVLKLKNKGGETSGKRKIEGLILDLSPIPLVATSIIKVTIPDRCQARLVLFNSLGKMIKLLAEGVYEPGDYYFTLHKGELDSGIYLISFTTEDSQITKKVVVY